MLFVRRVVTGLTVSGLTLAVSSVGQLVSVPILMASWGARTYGAWLALTDLASGMALVNLGIQSYVTNQLIVLTAEGGREAAARLLASALKLYALFSLTALSGIILALCLASPSSLVDTGGMSRAEATSVFLAYALIALYGVFGGVLMNLLRVGQELPRQLAYGLVERVIMLSVPMGAAAAGARPVHAAWTMIVSLGIAEVLFVLEVVRRTPVPVRPREGSLLQGLQLIKPSLYFFGSGLSTQLLTTGITLVISNTAGAVAVATFTTALMMTNLFRLFLNQVVNVLSGEVTLLFGRNDLARIGAWYRALWKGSVTAALAAAALVCVTGPGIIRVWTRDRIYLDFELNCLLAVYLVVHAPGILSVGFGLAMNKQRAIFLIQFAAAATAITIGAALVQKIGLSGVAWGLIVAQLLSTTAMTRLNRHWINPFRAQPAGATL